MKIIKLLIICIIVSACSNHSKAPNEIETMSSTFIEAIDPENELIFSKAINSVIGQEIEEVFYGIVNYQDRPFEFNGFHLCDQAVLLKLANKKWLNWVWVEEGFYQTGEINISVIDIQDKLADEFTQIKNVPNSKEWSKLIGRKINSIDYQTIVIKGNKHISDLKLYIDKTNVTICAIEEPDQYKLPILEDLSYSGNWTIIVFNERILEKHNRMNN